MVPPVEKHFQEEASTQRSLHYASLRVETTKGRAALPEREVAGPALFITLGHHFSGREICGIFSSHVDS
jgi:hypothetical protein